MLRLQCSSHLHDEDQNFNFQHLILILATSDFSIYSEQYRTSLPCLLHADLGYTYTCSLSFPIYVVSFSSRLRSTLLPGYSLNCGFVHYWASIINMKGLAILLLVHLFVFVHSISNVHRSQFPKQFLFGTATSSYQV